MAERLLDILDRYTPALTRALSEEGLTLDLGAGSFKLRLKGARPRRQVFRREAHEVLVGFEVPRKPKPEEPAARERPTEEGPSARAKPAARPEPKPRAKPAPKPPRQRPAHVKVLRFDANPAPPPVPRAQIALGRIHEALAMAPQEGASLPVLAAWFGVSPAALAPVLADAVEAGQLHQEGKHYRKPEAPPEDPVPEGPEAPEDPGLN